MAPQHPMPDRRHYAAAIQAWYKAQDASLRDLTAAELELFDAAVDAGAVIVPRRLRDWIAGADRIPFQWEGTVVLFEDTGDRAVVERVEAQRARQAAFIERVERGDLRAVVAAVDRERLAASVKAVAA